MRDALGEQLERWDAYLDGKITLADAYDENLPVARCRLTDGAEFDWNDEDGHLQSKAIVRSNPIVTAERALAAYKVNDATDHDELRRYVTVGMNAGMAQEEASTWALEVFWASDNRKPALACQVIPPESPRFRTACCAIMVTMTTWTFASFGGFEWLAWVLLHWRMW